MNVFKNITLVGACLLSIATSASGEIIQVKGGKLKINHMHLKGDDYTSKNWTSKKPLTVWKSGKQKGFKISTQNAAFTTFTIPTKRKFLSPKHESITKKHERYALFAGVKVPAHIAAKGMISIVTEDNKVLGKQIFDEKSSKEKIFWCVIPHDALVSHIGKPLKLMLRTSKSRSLIITEVKTQLIPETAESYMVNKSNGRRGPDRFQCGAIGFTGLTIHGHAPLPIMSVRENTPAADASLEKGDVIVGIENSGFFNNTCNPGNEWLEQGHEPVIAREVFKALQSDNKVTLEVFNAKSGDFRKVEISLKQTADMNGFPLSGAASEQFYNDLIKRVRAEQRKDGSWSTSRQSIATSFGLLALLGSRDEAHAEAIHKAADWIMNQSPETMQYKGYWDCSYLGIAMAEYALATGDPRAIQWVDKVLNPMKQGSHMSKWDTPVLGHGSNGLPYGNKSLLAPLIHMMTFDALATRLGIEHGHWDYFWPFIESCWSDPSTKRGHGSMGYNGSYKDKGEFWSRTGLTMIATQLRNDKMHVHRANRTFMKDHHGWMRNSHAYGAPGNIWGMIALGLAGEQYMKPMLKAWTPIIASQWEPGYGMRFTMPHMGAPYMSGDAIYSYPMATFMSLKNKGLHITGATEKGWLKINPNSELLEVRVLPNKSKFTVAPPYSKDLKVHFTLDGSAPSAKSPVWTKKLYLPEDGTITLRYISSNGKLGKISRHSLRVKENWKVLKANGFPDPTLSKLRAQFAFDNDSTTRWISNRGKDSKTSDWQVVIDRGINHAELVGLQFPVNKSSKITSLKVEASKDNKTWNQVFQGDISTDGLAKFSSIIQLRYLRVTIQKLEKEGDKLLLTDVKPIQVAPIVSYLAPGKVKVASPHTEWNNLRYTTDGRVPTLDDPKAPVGTLSVESGSLISVRAFNRENKGSEVSNTIIPLLPKLANISVSSAWRNDKTSKRHIIDGNPTTYWHSNRGGYPHTVTLEFEKAQSFTGIWQIPRTSGNRNGRINQYQISTSDTDDSWTIAYEGMWNYSGNDPVSSTFDYPISGKHFKLTALKGSDIYANIGELAFYSLPPQAWTKEVYANMHKAPTTEKVDDNSEEPAVEIHESTSISMDYIVYGLGGLVVLILLIILLTKKNKPQTPLQTPYT